MKDLRNNYFELDENIRNIARKTARVYNMEVEDFTQELWVFYLEMEEHFESLNAGINYIRTCLIRKSIDIGRASYRRTSPERNTDYTSTEGSMFIESNKVLQTTYETGYQNVRIEEIIDIFEHGTDEWKLAVVSGYLIGRIHQLEGKFNEIYNMLGSSQKREFDNYPVEKEYSKKFITRIFLNKDNNSGSMRAVDSKIRNKRRFV